MNIDEPKDRGTGAGTGAGTKMISVDEKQYNLLRFEKVFLLNKNDELVKEVNNLRKKTKILTIHYKNEISLRETVMTNEHDITKLKTEVEELKFKNENLLNEICELKKTIDVCFEVILNLRTERGKHDVAIDDLRAEIKDLKAENVELRAENVGLRAENVELRAENVELRAEIKDLRAENVELRAENIELRAKIKRQDILIGNLEEKIKLECNKSDYMLKLLTDSVNNQLFIKYIIAIQDINKQDSLDSRLDEDTKQNLILLNQERIEGCHYLNRIYSKTVIHERKLAFLTRIQEIPIEIKLMFENSYPTLLTSIENYIKTLEVIDISKQTADIIDRWWK